MKKLNLNLVVGFVAFLVYRLIYESVVAAKFSFGGFYIDDAQDNLAIIICLILYIVLMPRNKNSLIYLYSVVSFYFLLLPSGILYLIGGRELKFFLLMLVGVLLVNLFWTIFCRFKVLRLDGFVVKANINLVYVNFFVAIVLISVALTSGWVFNLNFSEVYDYRFGFNEAIKFPLNYILPFTAGPLLSFAAVYGLAKKKYFEFLYVLLAALLLYGFSSHKSFIFGPLLSVFLYVGLRRRIDLFNLMGGLMVLISFFTLYVSGDYDLILGSTFANRLLFIPSAITYEFLEEFSRIDYMFWAESKFGLGLFNSSLGINSVNYIAEIMTGNDQISANAGWIPNGYMNMGILGVVFYSIILGFVIFIIDGWSKNFESMVLVASFGQSIFNVVASIDLLAWLLTGGLFPMLIVLYLMVNRGELKRG